MVVGLRNKLCRERPFLVKWIGVNTIIICLKNFFSKDSQNVTLKEKESV